MDYDVRQLPRADYPEGLTEIPDVPPYLYIRGSLPPPDTKYLAVVGSRALTRYGQEACDYLVGGLSGYPVSIISGLALGADAAAHRAALSSGLHTIAIPGSGLADTVIAPRTNASLAQDILKSGGALISEHEPDHIPRAYDFPSRNRIMAGMAHAILMIEAGERSGTLITARLAGEYGRELLVVPHRIGDANGYGSRLFLRLGATLCAEPEHILEALGLQTKKEEAIQMRADGLQGAEALLYALIEAPQGRDELLRNSGLTHGETLTALVTLELKGLAKEEFGAWRRC